MKDFLKTRRRKTAAELGERKNPHGVSDTVREKEREREREREGGGYSMILLTSYYLQK